MEPTNLGLFLPEITVQILRIIPEGGASPYIFLGRLHQATTYTMGTLFSRNVFPSALEPAIISTKTDNYLLSI